MVFNNRKYFLITYKLNSITTIFGKPFFRKYTIIFNPDNKQIGHYIQEEEFNDNDNKNYKKNSILIIVILLLILILVDLSIILFKYSGRKKRKNELDENYDYISDKEGCIGIE